MSADSRFAVKVFIGVSIATLIFVVLACRFLFAASARQESVLSRLVSLTQERAEVLKALDSARYHEPGLGPLGSYLTKIRRDGVAKHAEMRRQLDEVSANTAVLIALLELHEPVARTESFRREARRFSSYATAWLDRWNGVMEVFMLGGNFPSVEVPYPSGFDQALAAEVAETR